MRRFLVSFSKPFAVMSVRTIVLFANSAKDISNYFSLPQFKDKIVLSVVEVSKDILSSYPNYACIPSAVDDAVPFDVFGEKYHLDMFKSYLDIPVSTALLHS